MELQVLVCFRSSRSLPTMINLIESTRGTGRRGLTIYAMHLVELSERPSAIAMVHKARRNGVPIWNKRRLSDTTDYIVVAFEAYKQLSSISVRPMTAISDLSTIHEDICTSTQLKRAAIFPFPSTSTSDSTAASSPSAGASTTSISRSFGAPHARSASSSTGALAPPFRSPQATSRLCSSSSSSVVGTIGRLSPTATAWQGTPA